MKIGQTVIINLDNDDEVLPDTSMDGKAGIITGFSGDREHGILVIVEGEGFRAAVWPHELITLDGAVREIEIATGMTMKEMVAEAVR